VFADDDDVILVLHGAIDAVLHRGDDTELVSGYDVVNWSEHHIAAARAGIELRATGSTAPDYESGFNLEKGTVPGAGIRIGLPRSAAPAAPPPGDFVSIVLADAEPEEEREPLPILVAVTDDGGGPAPTPAPPEPEPEAKLGQVMVTGRLCARGHFTSPDANYCGICGIAMVQLTHRPVRDVRPPLGYLVLDDGATFVLDRDYVIGREPGRDPDVRGGRAAPIVLVDGARRISRAHARIALDGWTVTVVDQESANGTFVAQPGALQWSRLPIRSAVPIQPGTRVQVGDRVLVFDSHYKP
jgi:hypothetical protein